REIRVEAPERPNLRRSLAGRLEHRARPEAPLSVGLAIVEAGVCQVCFGVDYRVELPRLRIEEIEAAHHRHDEAALLADCERAEEFWRGPGNVLAGCRLVAVDRRSPDVDPPEHLLLSVPIGAFAKQGTAVDD